MYLWMDKPITLVSKTTGEITEINYLANWNLVNAMTPVGEWPSDDEDLPDGNYPLSRAMAQRALCACLGKPIYRGSQTGRYKRFWPGAAQPGAAPRSDKISRMESCRCVRRI
jgi:hypothetical protein